MGRHAPEGLTQWPRPPAPERRAQAYPDYLRSAAGHENAAQNYRRPRNAEILRQYATQFRAIKTFTVDDVVGGWAKASPTHFKDGGSFDQIYQQV